MSNHSDINRMKNYDRELWINTMSDEDLKNTAAALVFIMLGQRALKLLTAHDLTQRVAQEKPSDIHW